MAVGTVIFVDALFYSAIAPLLPEMANQLRLAKGSAGLMTAGYPLGVLIGSLPAGFLSVRAGPKASVCGGLALIALATLAFALLNDVVLLGASRVLEGFGGALSWAGGLAWLAAASEPDHRGSVIGGVVAAGVGGTLVGPAIGALATEAGRRSTFTFVAVSVVLLIAPTCRLAAPPPALRPPALSLVSLLRGRTFLVGTWLVALPALVAGLVNVLGPLRLHRLGAGAPEIGATFLVGAAVQTAISPGVGRLSDRLGRLVPLRFGLALASGLVICFILPTSSLPMAVVIAGIAAMLGVFWAPAMAMLSDAAEAQGLDHALAAAIMNIAWAGGQIVGSGVGGPAANAAGDTLPISIAAGLCVVTLLMLTRLSRGVPGFVKR